MDTCGRSDTAALRCLQVARRAAKTPVLGVIGLDDDLDVLAEAARVLRRHRIPLVVATPRMATAVDYLAADEQLLEQQQPDNVFSAVPSTAAVARAVMAVAKGLRSPSVLVGTGASTVSLRAAERAARQLGVRLSSRHFLTDADVGSFLDALPGTSDESSPPVALLMEPEELTAFMGHVVKRPAARQVTWLLGSMAGSIRAQLAAQWALDLSSSAFLVEPHLFELAGLAGYFESHGLESHPLDDRVPHVVQAVSALSAAFHLQELSSCVQPDGVVNLTCRADAPSVPSKMISSLRQLSLPVSGAAGHSHHQQLEGTSNHFSSKGRLVANKYLVKKLVAGSGESLPVATYSDDDGLDLAAVMSSSSGFFGQQHSSSGLTPVPPFFASVQVAETEESPSSPAVTVLVVADDETGGKVDDIEEMTDNNLAPLPPPAASGRLDLVVHGAWQSGWHGRTWAASVLAIAATEFLAVLYILAVHLARCWDGTIAHPSSQSFSFLLMIVLLAQLAAAAACYVLVPGLLPSLPPVLLVAGYSILLVKLLRFRLLDSAGLGGSVPQFPLYLAAGLSVSVQVVLGSLAPSWVPTAAGQHSTAMLVLFSYLCALSVLTTGYALCLGQVRRRHTEAQLVAVGSLVSSGLLLSWATSVWVTDDPRYDEPLAAALTVLLTATVIGSVLIPKTVRLSTGGGASKLPSKTSPTLAAAGAVAGRPAAHHFASNISTVSSSPWLDYTFTHPHHRQNKFIPAGPAAVRQH